MMGKRVTDHAGQWELGWGLSVGEGHRRCLLNETGEGMESKDGLYGEEGSEGRVVWVAMEGEEERSRC